MYNGHFPNIQQWSIYILNRQCKQAKWLRHHTIDYYKRLIATYIGNINSNKCGRETQFQISMSRNKTLNIVLRPQYIVTNSNFL
jgi:hypothetical protein